jgi:integrase/recombinase XerC
MPGHDPALNAYLDSLRLRGLAATTITDRQHALDRMAATLGTPLADVTPAALLGWRRSLEYLSPGSVGTYVGHARAFYAWAQAAGLCDANPAAALPVPKLGRRIPRPISEDDLMCALDSAPRRIRLWIVLAAWAGLRAKEIALLRAGCIQVAAEPPLLLVAADATKGLSERTVPLSQFVIAEITLAGLPGSGFAFRREDGQPGPNTPNLVSHLANRHLHRMGIAATLHQLRHRFGTQAYRASGRDLRMTQELLGHARPDTTAGYAAWDRPAALAAMEALPAPRRLRAARRPAV